MLKFFTYLRNVYLSRCCEGGWRAYTRKGDGKWMRAEAFGPERYMYGNPTDVFEYEKFLFSD